VSQPTATGPSTVTWREIHDELTATIADPEALWLCEDASGFDGDDWHRHIDNAASQRGVARLDAMVARRQAGEPLQYVLGHWSFRTLDLAVDRRVLIPRPETEQVVEWALAELDALGGRDVATNVVDLGTGSGAIALSIAVERRRANVWAVERSADAAAVARANTAGIGRDGTRVTVVESVWFTKLPARLRGRVDLIVSNPPYVSDGDGLPPEVEGWEPLEALRSGADGLDDIRHIVASAPAWLTSEGTLVVEIAPSQAESVVGLAIEAGFVAAEVVVDLADRPRALIARMRPRTP